MNMSRANLSVVKSFFDDDFYLLGPLILANSKFKRTLTVIVLSELFKSSYDRSFGGQFSATLDTDPFGYTVNTFFCHG